MPKEICGMCTIGEGTDDAGGGVTEQTTSIFGLLDPLVSIIAILFQTRDPNKSQ